ncbi:MAG: hypothetical protein ACOZAN_01185 [Patescibacteria group bacterium]
MIDNDSNRLQYASWRVTQANIVAEREEALPNQHASKVFSSDVITAFKRRNSNGATDADYEQFQGIFAQFLNDLGNEGDSIIRRNPNLLQLMANEGFGKSTPQEIVEMIVQVDQLGTAQQGTDSKSNLVGALRGTVNAFFGYGSSKEMVDNYQGAIVGKRADGLGMNLQVRKEMSGGEVTVTKRLVDILIKAASEDGSDAVFNANMVRVVEAAHAARDLISKSDEAANALKDALERADYDNEQVDFSKLAQGAAELAHQLMAVYQYVRNHIIGRLLENAQSSLPKDKSKGLLIQENADVASLMAVFPEDWSLVGRLLAKPGRLLGKTLV